MKRHPSAFLTVTASLHLLALLFVLGALPLAAQDASGYFTVSQVNGVWWLIDPNGKQVVSRGLDVLQFDDTYVDASSVSALQQSNLKLYGSVEKWRTAIMQRMSDLGFNTAGAWSDPEFLGAHIDATLPLAETRIVYLGQPFVAEKFGNDAWKKPDIFPDVFDPDFKEFADQAADTACSPVRSNHWFIGWFSDNELSWGADWRTHDELLVRFLHLDPQSRGHKAAMALLQARYSDITAFNTAWKTAYDSWDALDADRHIQSPYRTISGAAQNVAGAPTAVDPGAQSFLADCNAFAGEVAENYFRITTEAIRRADPNHLLLGCRFAVPPPKPVIWAAGKYLDVVSFNCYDTNPTPKIALYAAGSGRPVLIGEFAFRGRDSGLPNTKGAGPIVATQQDRADDFEKYVKSALSQPNLIGYHWFEHADEPKGGRFDGENSNMGVVNLNGDLYTVLTTRMTQVNAQAETLHQQAK